MATGATVRSLSESLNRHYDPAAATLFPAGTKRVKAEARRDRPLAVPRQLAGGRYHRADLPDARLFPLAYSRFGTMGSGRWRGPGSPRRS